MTPRDYYYALDASQRELLATEADIKQDYLRKIMTGNRQPSPALARKLGSITPFNQAHWRPDVFGELAA